MKFIKVDGKTAKEYDWRIDGKVYTVEGIGADEILIKDFREYIDDVSYGFVSFQYNIYFGGGYPNDYSYKCGEVYAPLPYNDPYSDGLYYHLYMKRNLLEGIQLECNEPLTIPDDSLIAEFITEYPIN